MFQEFSNFIVTHVKTLITAVTVAVMGLLPQAGTTIKPIDTYPASPSATIEASASATPTIKPVIKRVATPKQSPTSELVYDGTRTGPMIDYDEYCTGKKIKILANEQMHFTDRSGKEHLFTTGDIHCLISRDSLAVLEDRKDDKNCDTLCQKHENIYKCKGVVNQYYDWRYKFCKDDKLCQKNAEDEKNQLSNQCSKEALK